MCGIVGYFAKSGSVQSPAGAKLLAMLTALAIRGPDSSGVAVWGAAADGLVLRVKPGDRRDEPTRQEIIRRLRRLGRTRVTAVHRTLLRLEIAKAEPAECVAAIEAVASDVEVVSMGRQLEIVKQVDAPRNLEAAFRVSRMTGSHGIGHTRLSTESRVDLSHSQPFWAHGTPDLAVVHNGHITNYHRLRRIYEQEGVRFYTENDSEIIGVYLARKMRDGTSLGEALEASVKELDGSFSYVAATGTALGYAKDPFSLKPLIVGDGPDAIAIANEEVAIHAALGSRYTAREADAAAVAVWEVPRARGGAPRQRRVA
jgi:methylamine---glutamate N-methyltransferase subunit A